MTATNNRTFRRLLACLLTATALVLVMCFFGEGPLSIIGRVSAAERVLYLKDVRIYEAETEAEARNACAADGYTFAGTDLNAGTERNYVYLGYKTTENREEALYKLSLLDMNGGYQIRDYAELYDEYEKSNAEAAQTLQMASEEFIDNYNSGSPRAIDAYDGLNLLYVPEAGDMGFGDYVVKGKTTDEFYQKVLTQASAGTVNSIINFLSAGLMPFEPMEIEIVDDSGKNPLTWAANLSDSSLWDVVGTSDLSEDEADMLDREYGDEARALHKQMQEFATGFENGMATYDEDEYNAEARNTTLEEVVDGMEDIEAADAGVVYVKAYDLLNEYDANPDMPLGQWIVEMGKMTGEEVDYTQIYPMIDTMSYAQVKMTGLTGFVSAASTLGKNEHSEEYTQILSTARQKLQELLGRDSYSIWSSCDKDMVDKKVAFTSNAIRQNAAQTLLNEEANDTFWQGMDIWEEGLKWCGIVSSGLTVLSFVFGQYAIGGLLAWIGKTAACASLTSFATSMCSVMGWICSAAGIFGLFILGITIVTLVYTAIMNWYRNNKVDKDYTTMPDYVIDAVKTENGYSSVKYKAVLNRSGQVGDLNGHKGHRGWVCMYTSTDYRVGSPIRADENGNIFVIRYGDPTKPDDCDCLNFFGQISPGNCNTNMQNDNVGGIYINYYTEKSLKNRNGGITPGLEPGQKPDITQSEQKQYYNTIIVKTGTKEDIAKSKITLEEHYIWDVNISPGARTKWETDGQYTYIGYKVTTDPKQAIRDIRVATFTPGGEVYFGGIKYGCAGTLGFPASSKEENEDYPENLDGLFFTRDENAGTPIEVGKLHLVNSFSQAQAGWEPVTTFSGAPYNFATTRYSSAGYGGFKFSRWKVYPFEYTGYCTEDDDEWNTTDAYLYYEPETTYTSGDTKYLSGVFFAFGTDSESTAALLREVEMDFTALTDKLKTFHNITVRDDINLAQSYQYKGFWPDSVQKYLYLCYTWSYNPYRALYGISAFQGPIYSSSLPYTIQKALSYPSTQAGAADKTMSYASSSVIVQRSTQHMWVVRGISPENAYMSPTGLIGQNTQVQEGYTDQRVGFFGNTGSTTNRALLPTGLYVSGYVAGKTPLTLDDVVVTTNAYTATEGSDGVLSVNVSGETTLGGAAAQGTFASVQDLKKPAETAPFNLAYPNWISDEKDRFTAGTPLYIYFRNTVYHKKYISRVFVGQSSRKDAKTDNEDILEAFDKQVDLNALALATSAGSDEVIPINVAADQDNAWYNRTDGKKLDVDPPEDQPAAYLSVARTDKAEEAITGLMLYKSSPDKAVPNQMNVDGAAYYCASNTMPIRMSNGNSYYLYYTYNIGVSSGGPITTLYAGSAPMVNGQTTALVADRADTKEKKSGMYGDDTLKTFIRAAYEKTEQTYFNKIYVASGSSENDAKLQLLTQGCTQCCDINLNHYAGGSYVYFGFRPFAINQMAIDLKNTDEQKEAERAAQMSQAVYDIVCTVNEPFKPEGFLSEKYQIYYTPVIWVDPTDKTRVKGVNLNSMNHGPEIYMYYSTPYAAKEYNKRVRNDPNAWLSQMPDTYYESPLIKVAFAMRDRVPYNDTVAKTDTVPDGVLRWEYVMQADSTEPIDLNYGMIMFDEDYLTDDNRITMFAQRENGQVKSGAEITGGFYDEYADIGTLYNVK